MSPQELFALPAALPILLFAPLAWFVLYTLDRVRARRLTRLLGPRVHVLAAELGIGRRRFRRTLFATALFLSLVAVLQPLWGEGVRRVEQRGVDILVGLDVSRSMLARDHAPSRLAAAKREIRELADRARGDRLGLVAFAGEATLNVPLTRDVESFASLVDGASPLSVERGGTDLGAALETALDALAGQTGQHEVVVLLTDGEDMEERGLRVAQTCRDRGITVHCVGFGSVRGSKIAVRGKDGETFLRDRSGRDVVTVMDPAGLRRIAEITGGEFVDAGDGPGSLVGLYEDRILPMARKAFEDEERRERENRYQWPLVAAFLLWILELCVTERRR